MDDALARLLGTTKASNLSYFGVSNYGHLEARQVGAMFPKAQDSPGSREEHQTRKWAPCLQGAHRPRSRSMHLRWAAWQRAAVRMRNATVVIAVIAPPPAPDGSVSYTVSHCIICCFIPQEHLACFFPGNMALGVYTGAVTGDKAAEYMRVAKAVTYTCWQMYERQPSGERPPQPVPDPCNSLQLFATPAQAVAHCAGHQDIGDWVLHSVLVAQHAGGGACCE